MSESTISIKVADGSFFPVLEPGFTGKKKLTLTTVKDNQNKVQIDLYSGGDASASDARYIGSLMIENIPSAPQGEPEIELLIALDEEGQLEAEASEKQTGESQRFSTSVTRLPEEDILGEPDFEVGETASPTLDFEEPPLTGETYGETETAHRPARPQRKGANVLLLAVFVLLGLLLVGAAAYFIWRATEGPGSATTAAPAVQQPAAQSSQPSAAASQPAAKPAPAPVAPAAQEPAAAPAAKAPAATPAPAPKPSAPAALTYRIKWGDTLWDLAATYYRNPWLYPRLARANGIKNPDLIIAGTRITIPQN